MLLRFSAVFLLLFLAVLTLNAQTRLQGTVTDSAGHPLAFVTVAVEAEQMSGAFTDIEGRFRIDLPASARAVEFRYVGYQSQRLLPEAWAGGKPLQIRLATDQLALPEAVVYAGENPADILMRKVIAHRDSNNPEQSGNYQCHTYNKIVFDALPNRERFEATISRRDTTKAAIKKAISDFNDMEKSMVEHHAFLIESVTERSFEPPHLVHERVLLNRVSGSEYAGVVALANLVQPFTFYGDYLQVIDKDFVNPVSPNSPDLYFFSMEDTLFNGPDTIWTLSFHPRKGKVFTGLSGTLNIHSDGYAVQYVRAWPTDTGNLEIKIEQSYDRVEGPRGRQWFPRQLNFELSMRKYPSPEMGIMAAGKSYIADVKLGQPLKLQDVDPEQFLIMDAGANTRSDSAWQRWREMAPLSEKEQHTYAWLDSLGKKRNITGVFHTMDYLATGLVPIWGPLNADLSKLLRFDDYEKVRIGIGISTALAMPLQLARRLEFRAYTGYGIRNKQWQYGADMLWRIHRGTQTKLALGWQTDLLEPGTLYALNKNELVDRFLYVRKSDRVTETWATLESRLGKSARVRASFSRQLNTPQYVYGYGRQEPLEQAPFHFTEASIFFRLAPNEEIHHLLGSNAGTVNHWPVAEIAFTHGFRGLLGGEYRYNRWSMALYQSVFIRRLGRCRWRIEAGFVNADVPLAKLFTLNQSPQSNGFNLFVVQNTFQSLPDTLFAANRFVNLYFSQEVGPVLYHLKYSAPFLVLHQHAAFGSLRQPELQHAGGLGALGQAIYESGIQADNLVLVNYVNFAQLGFGAALFYRYGALSSPDWQKNFSPRLSLRINL